MHFSLVLGPVPDIDTIHILDMVLSQVEYHFQDRHIPHHPHPVLDSRDRMALILVILEESQSLSIQQQRTLLMVLRYHLVQLMVQ